jgi:hypothetical protein
MQANRTYQFGHSCWRHTHGKISPDEKHPCFRCLHPIEIGTQECPDCHIMICPSCKTCLCTLTDQEYDTLVYVHFNYCRNLDEYDGTITFGKHHSLHIITNCLHVLNQCKQYEFNWRPPGPDEDFPR